jgi:cytochrome c
MARVIGSWPSVLALLALACFGARASQQLALDMGCYNCHGQPPKKNSPTFAELARRYEPHHGDAKAQQALVDKLRSGSIFSHINAHERLSEEAAAALVKWICDGAR